MANQYAKNAKNYNRTKAVKVTGYTRKDGTRVAGYSRTNPSR